MVREQGSRFIEKIRFDMNKKIATFEVPAHRNLDHAVVMIDFNSVSKPWYFSKLCGVQVDNYFRKTRT